MGKSAATTVNVATIVGTIVLVPFLGVEKNGAPSPLAAVGDRRRGANCLG